jgi:hypothetical protein
MSNGAFVAIVKVADRRNYIDHGTFCHGAYRIVEECATILDAEKAVERLTLERPLPHGEVYEPFHWLSSAPIKL